MKLDPHPLPKLNTRTSPRAAAAGSQMPRDAPHAEGLPVAAAATATAAAAAATDTAAAAATAAATAAASSETPTPSKRHRNSVYC